MLMHDEEKFIDFLVKRCTIEQCFNAMIERVPDKAWEEAEANKNYDAWFLGLKNQGYCNGER